MKNLKEKIKIYGYKKIFNILLLEIKYKLIMQTIKNSYSQKGEDLIIDNLLKNKNHGFYVDIGAYDPHRFSNTKRFYKKGWTGINIEPQTNNYRKFIKDRKKDINLNIGIGDIDSKIDFFKFIPDTLSTFSEKEAAEYQKQGFKLNERVKINMYKLGDVLLKYCPKDKKIDFLSIDTEGFDLEVLKSNNWNQFRPKLICIESTKHTLNEKKQKSTANRLELFLINIDYKKVFDNGLNSIYINVKNGKL